MGLAAKLQAAEQQQYGGFPQATQGQYGSAPQQFGGAPQGQPYYGGPPPNYQAQAQYGGQQTQQGLPGVDASSIEAKLRSIVAQNSLQKLYPEQRIRALAAEVAAKDLAGLARRWRLPPNLVMDLVAVALYDVVIMADDSGSMSFAENGERIEDLKALLSRIADAATMFDTDGISVRFMNSNQAANNLRTPDEIKEFVAKAKFGGLTPLGTMLDRKILRPFVFGPAQSGSLRKPVLVITITDGEPQGEPADAVRSTIREAKKTLNATPYGSGAVAFEFAQVGRDPQATKFLGKLDTDTKVGGMIDATSYIELEQEEYKKKGIDLTVDLYLVKLLVGAIDSSYDEQDEAAKPKSKTKSFLGALFK